MKISLSKRRMYLPVKTSWTRKVRRPMTLSKHQRSRKIDQHRFNPPGVEDHPKHAMDCLHSQLRTPPIQSQWMSKARSSPLKSFNHLLRLLSLSRPNLDPKALGPKVLLLSSRLPPLQLLQSRPPRPKSRKRLPKKSKSSLLLLLLPI